MAKSIAPPVPAEVSTPDRLLKKNVTAVHSTGLSLLQRKVFNALLLTAYDDLLVRDEHEIPVSVLKVLIDYKSKDLEGLRQALRDIRGKPVEFNLLDRGEGGTWTITGLLSEASISEGRCVFSFGKRMAEMLYQPDVYVLLNLRIQNRLTSSYTLNLYENVSRFRGVKSTGFHDVELWRKVLGAETKNYDQYKRFSSKVLAPAIREINEKSDLIIKLEEERRSGRGMPVARLKFSIEPNPQDSLAPFPVDAHAQLRETHAYQLLRTLGVADRLAIEAVSQDADRAVKIAQAVKAEHERGRIKSPAAYASKLIRDNAELSARQLELVGIKVPDKPSVPTSLAVPKPEPDAPPAIARATGAEADAKIRRAFDAERRRKAVGKIPSSELLEWKLRWREKAANTESFLLAGSNFVTGDLSPAAQQAFERFLVRELFGEATEDDVKRWVVSRIDA